MTTLGAYTHSVESIQGDHRHLKARLTWLHDQLASAGLTSGQTDRELAEMEAELEEHFTQEEGGGFFVAIIEAAPEASEKVQELLRQHRQFRTTFRALRKTCRWACGESGTRAGWMAAFAEFHRAFDDHECTEHELLYEALQRDVGAAD